MPDCETNDCRKEKMGCKGCFYDKNFDNSHDYILKLNTREELIEHSLKLLDELERKEKTIATKIIIINSKNEYIKCLEEYVKELGGEI